MANFCSKCGKPVNAEAAFCSNCGANLQPVESNNSASNDNKQNNDNNDDLTSNNTNQETTPTNVQDNSSNTITELAENNQSNPEYQQIELSELLKNLDKTFIGKKIRTTGYAHNYERQGYDVIGLFPDKKGSLIRDNLCIDFRGLSEDVRKDVAVRLQIASCHFKAIYLDFTVEGQIKDGGILYGLYLEVDDVYYDKSQTVKISEKSRWKAFWLTLFLGFFGLGRFYLGQYFIGIFEIILSFLIPPIWLIDAFFIICWPTLKDGKGNYVP